MSYDLAVWEGVKPADDKIAGGVYEGMMELMEKDGDVPPTPRIRAYVDALLERWPDIDESEDSPWSMSPLIDAANGSLIYFPMVFSMAEEASAFAAGVASDHDLVCYDPQLERLRL
ncbi:hypothetical protein [Nonomuraea sp. bgisy101]|uniref:hypothetical protein n=1 Tax=Nonomuraea sp. bgisy101 TaxID=3413784 RepID=UPI003D756B84